MAIRITTTHKLLLLILTGVFLVCLAAAVLVDGLLIPVRVVGASMAEAFLGPHYRVTCPQCRYRFAVDATLSPPSQKVGCPNCGHQNIELENASVQPGERLLVDRWTYRFRDPGRWEPVLFRSVDPPLEYCLKRVVGLPYEKVQIVAGDVWINGQCVKKDWSTLRPMAILIHDASFDAPRRDIPSRWRPVTQVNRWKKRERGFRFSRNPAIDVSEGTGWIGYQHFDFVRGVPWERERITDDYAYNQTLSRSLSSMGDLILSAQVRSQGGGTLKFRLGTCELQLDASSERGLLLHENRPVAQCVWDGERISHDTRLEIAVVDRQFFFVIEGEVLLRYDLDKNDLDESALGDSFGSTDQQEGANPADNAMLLDPRWYLAIGAKNLDLDITEVQILRDVYYTDQIVGVAHTRRGECQLGEGQFFVLGDNSPLSLDSRREGAETLMERADIRGCAVRWR